MRQLLRGRRTISELAELIFTTEPSSSDFHSCYVRAWRAVRELEAKGLVSTPVLGKDKAYRLTRHGLGVLMDISENHERIYHGIFSLWDAVLFTSTIGAGSVSYLLSGSSPFVMTVFVFLLGASTCKILISLRGVW